MYYMYDTSGGTVMVNRPVSIRIPEIIRAQIDEIGRRSKRGFSSIVNEMLEEAVRMRRIPGIVFADEFQRREAKVGGTGLGVWEVIETYQLVHEDWERFKGYYDWLDEFQLRASLTYWRAYPEAIDALIAENASWTEEKLYAVYPSLKPPPPPGLRRIAET